MKWIAEAIMHNTKQFNYQRICLLLLSHNLASAGFNMLNVNQPTDNNSRLFFLMSHAKFYFPLFQEILWKDITNFFLSMWANFHGKLLPTRWNCWRLIYRLLIEVCWCLKKLRWGLFLDFSVLTKLISMKTFSSSLLTIEYYNTKCRRLLHKNKSTISIDI